MLSEEHEKVIAKQLITLAAAAVVALGASAARADDVRPGGTSDYLIHVGKQPVWASQAKKTETRPDGGAERRREAKTRLTPVTVGKRTLVAVNGVVRDPVCPAHGPLLAKGTPESCEIEGGICTAATTARKHSRTESRGYFRQNGKAIEWVPAPRRESL